MEVTERANLKMIRLLTGLGEGCNIYTVSPFSGQMWNKWKLALNQIAT